MRWLICVPTLAVFGCTEVSITPIDNKPPEAQILTHQDGDAVREGYLVQLGGAVNDERGIEQVTAHWFVDEVEVCTESPNEDGGTFCQWEVPQADEARVRLEARDGNGARANAIVDLIVDPNLPPTVTITLPLSTNNYYNNADVPLEGTASDTEDDPSELLITWESNVDGALPEADTAPDARGVFASSRLLSEGPHELTVTATDLGGKQATDVVSIVVGGPNTPPTCEITFPPDGAESGQFNEVVFAGLVGDADIPEEELTVVFESDNDGLMGAAVPTENGDVLFAYDQLATLGEHVISMTVTDDAGTSCIDTVVHTVIEPPTAPVVHIEPTEPGAGDDLLCVLDVPSVDPQGDPLTYDFSWSFDGVAFDGPTTNVLPNDTVLWPFTGPGQAWTCEGRATDGASTSSPGTDTVTIETPTVVTVYAGQDHSCQIDTNTTLECWGDNSFGVQDLEGGLYTSMGMGDNHTCGIDVYGRIQCLGNDVDGQVSGAPLAGVWEQIDAGEAHNCALAGGSITCWGLDDEGQSDASALTGTYTQVSSAFRHNCAVRTDDALDCWGSDVFGRSTPTPTVLWSAVSAGKYHTCGLDLTNEAWCFGKDTQGQSSPPGGSFDQIAAGTDVTCGLRGTGVIECWGELTGPGELFDPPVGVFAYISAGNGHFCAVTDTGAAECWGDNAFGELDAPLTWW